MTKPFTGESDSQLLCAPPITSHVQQVVGNIKHLSMAPTVQDTKLHANSETQLMPPASRQ